MEDKKEFLAKNRVRIETTYEERMLQVPNIYGEVEQKLAVCRTEEALAVRYLYATMPYSDMGNYSFETFMDFAIHGVFLWESSETVRMLPEEIFLNYILYHRVNEEEIASCRRFFYQQIKDRIAGMDIGQAAVEVNYWCAQEVTYQASDDRTLSAMTVYRRGSGRCGEESVFAVNVLRSAGIPARQVYAPKWSHCDDNHAWVEILSAGKWHFIGACEPAEIFNKGWFTHAASRALMVHGRLFDVPDPKQNISGKEGMVTMLNELSRYARVKVINVTVRDDKGRKVCGAEVDFEVMNYSEYAIIASGITDQNGQVSLTTGLGSIHIYAVMDGISGARWVDIRTEEVCEIVLEAPKGEDIWVSHDIIAPADAPINTAAPTKEQRERAKERIREAAARRKIKTEGWSNSEREKFLAGEDYPEYRQEMLAVLTEKDQTDLKYDVLEEHLKHSVIYAEKLPTEIFVPYILNPRIDNEILRKYREEINGMLSESVKEVMRQNPREIWKFITARIESCPAGERDSLITMPTASLQLNIASEKSQWVLFVAIARTLGIPARLNPIDGRIEYLDGGEFVSVQSESEQSGMLMLKAKKAAQWNYFQNWSIAYLKAGKYQSLKLSDEWWQDGILKLNTRAGRYRILTANRLPNGNILAYKYEFHLVANLQKEVELKLRSAELKDMLVHIPLPDFTLNQADGPFVNKAALIGEKMHILIFLAEGEEPSEHILNEMLERKEAFFKYGSQIIFVLKTTKALADPTITKVLKTFDNIQVCYDNSEELVELLGRRMYVDFEQLPLIIVTDVKGNGIYAASGYNVGTGDILLKLMNRK
ncbi:MAG: transglutaminase-like domain-containing protein [Lachnospiraceae bacterium]